jgi:excinuclease ABC subunit A
MRNTDPQGTAVNSAFRTPRSALTLAAFYALPLRDALAVVEELVEARGGRTNDPLSVALCEVRNRLGFLVEVGLGYLTLDRTTRSLSGGETERVNLTTCLGSGLVNTLYVLDEPSVGLHPRDTDRLVRILHRLRDAGNTVVVVEHEASVIRAADQVVDLGPAQGERGGEVVFQGDLKALRKSKASLTGQYLDGRKRIELPGRRPVLVGQASSLSPDQSEDTNGTKHHSSPPATPALKEVFQPFGDRLEACPALVLTHAARHNLKDITVEIPLHRFVCVTGVSGSGKTTLIREVLLPLIQSHVTADAPSTTGAEKLADEENNEGDEVNEMESQRGPSLTGCEALGRVLMVDQSSLGRTPRSNPAVYIGAFDAIREFFAQSEAARQRGLTASNFSFNSPQGQCERCRGAGFEKIEMQFLSDVFIRCPDCDGRRYRGHILEVKVQSAERGTQEEGAESAPADSALRAPRSALDWSIADMLEATVDDAITFLGGFDASRPAQKAVGSLRWLQDVGLGYLRLGQPINTLSGGECQRLKLVRHLADCVGNPKSESRNPKQARSTNDAAASTQHAAFGSFSDLGLRPSDFNPTLFLFDEPTTGLHFDDVRVLVGVFQRLVDAGHSVLVIEHNLDVIKCADWVIDLGPDAGDEGGQVVVAGTPETVASCERSHTGLALAPLLTTSGRRVVYTSRLGR